MQEIQIEKYILKQKPTAILLSLKDEQQVWYPSKLARYSAASYVYTINFLNKLNKAGLIIFDKQSKKKIVKLSDKGKVIVGFLDELINRLNQKPIVQQPSQQPS
jgi:predicted transcriptional regulator